ncbi:major facilitator superfamily domain-containing protein [Pelagophyceae sp. CCMP2097]|nr:major facilitator superfamily domain-containing protein [Pelagophyceae sp. CCMP2097]
MSRVNDAWYRPVEDDDDVVVEAVDDDVADEEALDAVIDRPSEPDEATVSLSALAACYVVAFVSSMDNAIMLPSLWPYVEQLCREDGRGQDAHRAYGAAQCVFFATRVAAMWFLGQRVDKGDSYATLFTTCLATGVVGALLYGTAPWLGRGWSIHGLFAGRALLGASSAISVLSLSFVASFVPKSQRTPIFRVAKIIALQRASTPLGPLLVLGLDLLPDKASKLGVSSYSGAGFVVSGFNVAALFVVVSFFKEPPRLSKACRDRPAPPSCRQILTTLRSTGAWASYFFSFQNNWTNQTILWTLPLITADLYGEDVVRDSAIFAAGGCVGIATALSIACWKGRFRDGTMILAAQLGAGGVLGALALSFGCPKLLSTHRRPLWLLCLLFMVYHVPFKFIAQMPSNNALYTKLVSDAAGSHQGVYQALLEISKAGARGLAGLAIGQAYASQGPCALWGLSLAVWALQFAPLSITWQRLGAPDAPPAPPRTALARRPARNEPRLARNEPRFQRLEVT